MATSYDNTNYELQDQLDLLNIHAITNKGNAYSSGLYKITTNAEGHVTNAVAAVKSDITALGIPAQDTVYTLPKATTTALGGIAVGYTTAGKNYAVQVDSDGNAYVNVPWSDSDTTYSAGTGIDISNSNAISLATSGVTAGSYGQSAAVTGSDGATVSIPYITVDSYGRITSISNKTYTAQDKNTTYSAATSSTYGLVKIGYTASGKNYPVELSDGQMYVNVPWTDNNTTYSAGTGLSLSGTTFSVKTGYTTSGKNYKVQADSNGNLYVNVPWTDTDTNTTYSAGTGLSLSSTTFSLATSGVTAGSYGPSANVTGNNGNTISVPYITVDKYGRITSISNKTYTSVNTDTNTTYTFTNKAATLAWNTTTTIATVGGTNITVKLPANPNTDHYAWSDITSKPATATRWPAWSEVTSKPISDNLVFAQFGSAVAIQNNAAAIIFARGWSATPLAGALFQVLGGYDATRIAGWEGITCSRTNGNQYNFSSAEGTTVVGWAISRAP